MKNKQLLVYAAMLCAMFFWGLSFIWTKKVLEWYDPITTIMFRLIFSSVFLWSLNIWIKRIQKLNRKEILMQLVLAIFQPLLYFIGENYGVKHVSSTVAAVLISTIPLFSPIAAYMFLKERISMMNLIGVIVSVVGVLFVIMKSDLSLDASPIGVAFLMLAVFAAIIYSVLLVKFSGKFNVYTIISYQNLIGVFLFIPLFFILDFSSFKEVGFVLEPFIPIVQLSIFASSLAFVFFTYGVQKLGVTKANIFSNTIPVFTAIFAWILLGEVLSLQNVLGIVIVIVGLFMSQINRATFARTKLFFIKLRSHSGNTNS